MINFREIFNMNYSYIGLIIIGILMIILILLDKNKSLKVIGYSFLVSGITMGLMFILGNLLVNSFSYSFFIKIITNNFFNSIIIFSIISIIIGSISFGTYKWCNIK